jgi:hypothetical protein
MGEKPSFGISYEKSVLCPCCHNTASVLWHLWNGKEVKPPKCRECLESNVTSAHRSMLDRCR